MEFGIVEKILLLGNGSSVLDYEYGDIIDSNFDFIFRINRFRTINFEKYVGSKTDAWITVDYVADWIINQDQTDNCEASNLEILSKIPLVYFFIPEFKYEYEVNRILNLGLDSKKYQIIPKSIENQINSIVDFKPLWPTTGAVSLQLLVNSYEDIYIHGFDFHDKKYKHYHYFDGNEERTTERRWENQNDHNLIKDRQFMQSLIKKYNIKVLSESYKEFDE